MRAGSLAASLRAATTIDMQGHVEAVVDASIAEIPMHFWQPHRMVRKCGDTGELQPIGRGKTHLMGRLCMEHDIIASNVQLPEGTLWR